MCRACGFDLFGAPPGTTTCSECGAYLKSRGAVLDGHRRRHSGLITIGLILIGFALTAGGLIGWKRATGFDVNRIKPTWWLVRETASASPPIAELLRRLGAGELSQETIDVVADRALAVQGDASKQWLSPWGDFVEAARGLGRLDDQRWERYAAQAPVFELVPRAIIRRGDPIPYWISERPARLGINCAFGCTIKVQETRLGAADARHAAGHGGTDLSLNGGGSTGSHVNWTAALDALPNGEHILQMKVDLLVSDSAHGGKPVSPSVVLTKPLTLQAADQISVKLVRDESLRSEVERAIEVRQTFNNTVPPSIDLRINVNRSPVGLSYEVFGRGADGREVRFGDIAARGGRNRSDGRFVRAPAADLPDDRIDLIFRPSTRPAIESTDTFEMWEGEVVIKDVPIVRPGVTSEQVIRKFTPPATRPAQPWLPGGRAH